MNYKVESGDTLSKIAIENNTTVERLLVLNPQIREHPDRISVGDTIHLDNRKIEDSSKMPIHLEETESLAASFTVRRGQLTFDAEGLEKPGSQFHSRVLHVPSSSSGATIGRGYDMKERKPANVKADLVRCGVSEDISSTLSELAGLEGSEARAFIKEKDLVSLEISAEQQKKLFDLVYDELERDVIRICTKKDVVNKYGQTHWEELDDRLRDVLVDLRYRGDYTPTTRRTIQICVVENDFSKFCDCLSDKEYWITKRRVPRDRFERRVNHLTKAREGTD